MIKSQQYFVWIIPLLCLFFGEVIGVEKEYLFTNLHRRLFLIVYVACLFVGMMREGLLCFVGGYEFGVRMQPLGFDKAHSIIFMPDCALHPNKFAASPQVLCLI